MRLNRKTQIKHINDYTISIITNYIIMDETIIQRFLPNIESVNKNENDITVVFNKPVNDLSVDFKLFIDLLQN